MAKRFGRQVPRIETAFVTPFTLQLANSRLSPERQSRWDTGVDDVGVGGKGSVSVTYYDQVASDLIEGVTLNVDTSPIVQQLPEPTAECGIRGSKFEGSYRLPVGQAVSTIRDH